MIGLDIASVCVERAKQVGVLWQNWENNFWHLVLLIKKPIRPHTFENSTLEQLNGFLQPVVLFMVMFYCLLL